MVHESNMGCTNFKSGNDVIKSDQEKNIQNKNIPYLTEAEKVLIQSNWQGLKLHIANIGVMTYVRFVYFISL